MSRLNISFAIALALILFASCGQRKKSQLPDATKGRSLTNEAIESSIKALAVSDWQPQQYGEILHNQIEAATEIAAPDRTALTKMLREAAADQMLRCADSIMTLSCADSHQKLSAMADSLTALAPQLENSYKAAEITALKARYDLHRRMMGFSVASVYSKSVGPYSSYDYSYDSERRSTAASYRSKKPTCTAVQKKIDAAAVNAALSSRRADFNRKLQRAREREAAASY